MRILVASDLSPGADRALRRATLIAKPRHAQIVLAHVLGEQAAAEEEGEAEALLAKLATTVRDLDGVQCEAKIAAGEAPETIAALAAEADADLVVTGPPRREAVRNLFVGTTAGRSAKVSRAPLIVAAGVPAGAYEQILFATDLSQTSAAAILEARQLGLVDGARTIAFYAFGAPAEGLMIRSDVGRAELQAYLVDEALRARGQLSDFLAEAGLHVDEEIVGLIEAQPAGAVREAARRVRADLLVIGARGRSTLESVLLGSVAGELLRSAQIDVFVAPPATAASGPAAG